MSRIRQLERIIVAIMTGPLSPGQHVDLLHSLTDEQQSTVFTLCGRRFDRAREEMAGARRCRARRSA